MSDNPPEKKPFKNPAQAGASPQHLRLSHFCQELFHPAEPFSPILWEPIKTLAHHKYLIPTVSTGLGAAALAAWYIVYMIQTKQDLQYNHETRIQPVWERMDLSKPTYNKFLNPSCRKYCPMPDVQKLRELIMDPPFPKKCVPKPRPVCPPPPPPDRC